jgi:hypothetical protein
MEPLNMASGLAFFVSAWQAWKQLDRDRWREQWDLHLLSGLIALVGIASFLWHASGIAWTQWFDAAAIAAFVLVYWSVFLARIQRLKTLGMFVAWAITAAGLAGLLAIIPMGAFAGTFSYLPLLVLLVVGMGLAFRVDRRLGRDLLLAAAIFILALVVRALDLLLCDWAVVGTHWLWHLLVAGLLFVLVDGLIRHARLREEQARDGG